MRDGLSPFGPKRSFLATLQTACKTKDLLECKDGIHKLGELVALQSPPKVYGEFDTGTRYMVKLMAPSATIHETSHMEDAESADSVSSAF